MKVKSSLFFTGAALAFLWTASPLRLGAETVDPANLRPIERGDLIPRVKGAFDVVRKTLNKDNEAVGVHITNVENAFIARAESVLDKKNYPLEAAYLAQSLGDLVIPKLSQEVKKLNIMAVNSGNAAKVAKAQAELEEIGKQFSAKEAAFNATFAKEHEKEIAAIVKLRFADRIAAGNPEIETLPDGTKRNRTALPGSAENFAYFWHKSPVIGVGFQVIDSVVNQGGGSYKPPEPAAGGPGTVTPKPPGNPGGSAPNVPGNGQPNVPGNGPPSVPDGGNASGSGSGGTSLSDILRGISRAGAPRVIGNEASKALQDGRYSDAMSMAQLALQYDPKNKDLMGVLYVAKARGEGSGAAAAGLAAAQGGAAAFAPSGFAAGPAGDARPSAEIAALAAASRARASAAQAENAKSALRLGDNRSALEALDKALAQDPNNPALLSLRAQTYGNLGRWEDALKDAAKGLALAPGSLALMRTKALAENRTHRYRDALETSERMIAADPRGAWGYANRAHAWAGLGNRDAMLADIGRAASLDPSFQRAAADAALLQLPSDADVMFLFPGEAGTAASAPAAAPPGRARSFGVVAGAAFGGGLLLALGLLSMALAPIKDSVVAVFTKAQRRAPDAASPVASAPAATGSVIRGQYEISGQIGAGGMGMVYEGTDRSLGRRVAIKKMREELRLNARERDRFVIEAKTVASLHHPNIVDIYAIVEEGEDVYLVFEYVDGKTVHDLVQNDGRLGVAEAVSITRSMGEALTYAHSRGVIHRDMKPSNVMLTKDGAIKVMDFGIARMAKDALTRYSMTNTVVGTPPYMAPEQEQGVVRKESDVYSLAICSYEMLTGKLPFIGIGAGMLMNKINMSYVPPARTIAGLPEALDGVFLKAFQADPEQRYRTPSEFVAALAAAADGARSKTA